MNIFCALVLLSVVGYRQGSIGIEKREWDLLTVTASDYTLEISLTRDQIDSMRKEMAAENFMLKESDGLRLKLYMI